MKAFKAILIAYWNFLFYPLLFGLFIWLWVKDAHWVWGALVIAAMLLFDPLWRRLIFRK